MKQLAVTKARFDETSAVLEALARDWAERESTSFDQAVSQDEHPRNQGTIWAMPVIDSKRIVGLLVELEPVIGCEIPCSVIRRGGYSDRNRLVTDLMARIRERCMDEAATPTVAKSVVAETAPVRAR